jgi:hypothetical protein
MERLMVLLDGAAYVWLPIPTVRSAIPLMVMGGRGAAMGAEAVLGSSGARALSGENSSRSRFAG